MNAEVKAKWIEALRSGRYAQGQRWLHLDDSYCCLGVLHEVVGGQWDKGDDLVAVCHPTHRRTGSFCGETLVELGLQEAHQRTLISLNDDGETFGDIAAWIEENL